MNDTTPNPYCACGCGLEVSRPSHKFYFGHKRYHDGPPRDPSEYRMKPQPVMRIEDVRFEMKIIGLKKMISEARAKHPTPPAEPRHRLSYRDRKTLGLCGRCLSLAIPGETLCERHKLEAATRQRMLRATPRVAPDLMKCLRCPNIRDRQDRTRCAECRERNNSECRRRYARTGRKDRNATDRAA